MRYDAGVDFPGFEVENNSLYGNTAGSGEEEFSAVILG